MSARSASLSAVSADKTRSLAAVMDESSWLRENMPPEVRVEPCLLDPWRPLRLSRSEDDSDEDRRRLKKPFFEPESIECLVL